jgi:hypothetical protein
MMFRTFVRPLFVALSLAFATTAAAPAFADGADAKTEAKGKEKSHEHGKGKGKDKAHFPMTADKFTKAVDKRIEHAKTKLEAGIKKNSVSDTEKAKLLKSFDDGAALVRAAAKKAGSDGEVTKAEAQEVHALAKTLHKQIRTELKGKAKGKTV